MSTSLREINPNSILKNIFHLDRSSNATVKVYFKLLALWRNCPRHTEPQVIRYLERAGIHLLKYRGEDFVEFLRRVLDFPRRGVLNVRSPDFSDLSNDVIAAAYGASHRLQASTIIPTTQASNVTR